MGPDTNALVRQRFALVDRGTSAFASRHNIACPPGCGACCHSPNVEASAEEFGPLVERLFGEHRAEAVRERLIERARTGDTRCALFEPGPAGSTAGRCSEYGDRPLVCRLFGFSARRNRGGQGELVACATMRAADPAGVGRAEAAVAAGAEVLYLGDHTTAGAALGPASEGALVPINQALWEAIERKRLLDWYASMEQPEAETDPEAERPEPPRPQHPPRPAA